jgi:hypothetical protein
MLKNISWSRGFFRLWSVYALIVVIVTGVNIYNEKLYMPKEIWHTTDLTSLTPKEHLNALKAMAKQAVKLGREYPEYEYMKSQELFNKVYDRFYSDMPRKEFYKKLGLQTLTISIPDSGNFLITSFQATDKQELLNYAESYIKTEQADLYDERMEILQIGLGFLFVPMLTGLLIKWVLLGFRSEKVS